MAQVLVLVMVTLVSINANGLHTDMKWQPFWNEIPHADIICIQEMHLTNTQKFAFGLYAQGYEFFYSHGTSASAGVCGCQKETWYGDIPCGKHSRKADCLGSCRGMHFLLCDKCVCSKLIFGME